MPLAVPDAAADGLPSSALQRHPLAITTPQLPCAKVSLGDSNVCLEDYVTRRQEKATTLGEFSKIKCVNSRL